MNEANKGVLYICGTPIGNLEDITLRALRILQEVDLIAAEDTRHTIKLLNHYEIKKPMTSYHEHNKVSKGEYLIEQLKTGKQIALVSDAGMPGISDPGYDLINVALQERIPVVPIPGPTAFVTGLVISGLPTQRFVFEGFLSRTKKQRRAILEKCCSEERTLIFYESPHRLKETLKEMLNILGNRQVVVARELTKRYEEIKRGNLQQVAESFQGENVKGEITLIVSGAMPDEQSDLVENDEPFFVQVEKYMAEGLTKKEAIKKVASERHISKRIVYREVIEAEKRQSASPDENADCKKNF